MHTSRTIVVVDDQPSIRDLFRIVLQSGGYTVHTSCDGIDALRQLHRHPTDLLITDLVMPGQEGLETIAQVRKHFPGMKILVVSGFEEYFKAARLFGANETLAKPVDATTLREKVGALIGH